jgi:hypothetical protein
MWLGVSALKLSFSALTGLNLKLWFISKNTGLGFLWRFSFKLNYLTLPLFKFEKSLYRFAPIDCWNNTPLFSAPSLHDQGFIQWDSGFPSE